MGAAGVVIFSRDEVDLIAALAGCSLDEKPGTNWVQSNGGLPEYICRIARAIKKTGKTTSQAIAIAVSRVKKWAAGADDVDADTRAKAAAALAEWEKLKAKSHAKSAAKKVKASNTGDGDVLLLAKTTDYNVDMVRSAFRERSSKARNEYFAQNPSAPYDKAPSYMYVRELWTKFLIAQGDTEDGSKGMYKIPYTVDSKLNVDFGEPQRVTTAYVAVPAGDIDDTTLDDKTLAALANVATAACAYTGEPERITLTSVSALDRVLKLHRVTDGGE